MLHSKKTIGYIPGLDGFRTLAVFAVIIYHLGLSWLPSGLLGVNLFFVLSGYLITNILFKQQEQLGKIDLVDFWIRRARRLLPALFLMLGALMLWAIFFAPEQLNTLKNEMLAVTFYVGNWYLIFHKVSYFESFGPPSPLGHLWSLAIEEQFYLIWPIVLSTGFYLLKKKKWIILGTAIVAIFSAQLMMMVYMPGVDPSRVYYGTDTRAFALLLGAIAAMLFPSDKMTDNIYGAKRIFLNSAGAISLFLIFWMMVKTNQYYPFLYRGGLFIFSLVAAAFVVILAHPSSCFGKMFGWAPLRLLGKWSYGIYLWHYPVIILSTPLVNTEGPNALRSIIQVSVSIALAALSFYLVEEPIRYRTVRAPALCFRAAVCFLLVFMVAAATSIGGVQTMAKDLSKVEEIEEIEETKIADAKTDISDETLSDFKEEIEIKGEDITIITDSLLIDAKPMIEERLPGILISTKKGRQMYDAGEVMGELERKGELGETVVIALGSNGAFTEKQLMNVLDFLGDARDIILINTRVPKPWEAIVNETMSKVSESYGGVKIADWHKASKGHDEYFYKDGVHLTKAGMEAYYDLLRDALE